MKTIAAAALLSALAWTSSALAVQGGVLDTPSAFAIGVIGDDRQDGSTCLVFTRLDIHRDLMVGTAESASNGWALYPRPAWADRPPPPDAGPDDPDGGAGGADRPRRRPLRREDGARRRCARGEWRGRDGRRRVPIGAENGPVRSGADRQCSSGRAREAATQRFLASGHRKNRALCSGTRKQRERR